MLHYVGAGANLDPDRALALDDQRWAWQPKVDGMYVTVQTDAAGRVISVMSRAGRELAEATDLLGVVASAPCSVLMGELEAHTEAGNRIAAARGWRNLHLFDATHIYGHAIASLPYLRRWAALHRGAGWVQAEGLGELEPTQEDPRRWTWFRPVDVGEPALPPATPAGDAAAALEAWTPRPLRERRWSPPGTMVAGGPPRDLRRFPIVPLARGRAAGRELWRDHVERGGGEGIVAVRLDAAAGARGAKRKVKMRDTIDAVVAAVCPTAASLVYNNVVFQVSARGKRRPRVGEVVAVAHDGWYESSSEPRFARIVGFRDDLSTPA